MNYLENLFGLRGKSAVVIGGTGELCGAMAEGLAGAGAYVYLVGRNKEKAESRLEKMRSIDGQGEFIPCDVSQKQELDQLRDRILEKTPNIDVLVNGAGINSPTPFLEITEEEFDRILSVNLKSVLLSCQTFGQVMLEQGQGGSIINLGSISGLNPLSRVFSYSASKGAVHNLSKNLAREWAPHNIRVNILVPGFFPAEQNRKVLTPDRVESIMNHTPMDRFGDKEELIGATLLLASANAGSFITGTEMVVDGGYNCMTI
ncbi:MAG: gluconate 5-dehydrogenase [Opitutae bacterium]|nr:gluconate 5-dehydrogenase [Opitutae bacterium]|tara:strand:- start:3359 stop:4138 length:780 start_codon:yes stop_codon:yes gene_type:complete